MQYIQIGLTNSIFLLPVKVFILDYPSLHESSLFPGLDILISLNLKYLYPNNSKLIVR